MSNLTIVQRMRRLCDHWEAGAINSVELGQQVVALASALEGVRRGLIEEAREWELELTRASDSADFDEHDRALAEVTVVVARIRAWIEGLAIL
jgi:hypothetical protein